MKALLLIKGHIGKPESSFWDSLFNEEEQPSFTELDLDVFLAANKDATEFEITIESGGGYVEEGFNIFDKLIKSGKEITTIAKQADSIASIIFLAGNIRKVYKSAKPLLHYPFIENLFLENATADDLKGIHDSIKSVQNKIIKVYNERTGTDSDLLIPIMEKNESISAEKFIELGFASELIVEIDSPVTNVSFEVLAKLKAFNNLKSMKNKNELINWFQKIESMIKNFGTPEEPTYKAISLKCKDGSELFVKTLISNSCPVAKDLIFKNSDLTEKNEVTGELELETGETLVAANGEVSEIKAKVEKTQEEIIAELRAENADLRTQNEAKAALQTELDSTKAENVQLKEKISNFNQIKSSNELAVKNLKSELEDLKKMVLDPEESGSGSTEKTQAQKDLEIRRNLRRKN
jgi:ATP-dependent protease ClpP protease subunit